MEKKTTLFSPPVFMFLPIFLESKLWANATIPNFSWTFKDFRKNQLTHVFR